MRRTVKTLVKKAKRGDTIVEVMFAFAIFSLVAVVTVSMMNLGLATGERSLELVTARNELNAQAEALRFIHSSYISEKTLPECTTDLISKGEKCQQFKALWSDIASNAVGARDSGELNSFTINYPVGNCKEAYDENTLSKNHAFVVNARKLLPDKKKDDDTYSFDASAIVRAKADDDSGNLFHEPTLNARIVYSLDTGRYGGDGDDNSEKILSDAQLTDYTKIASVEGIWVVAVKGPNTIGSSEPQYHDFYIQTCWYGSNRSLPTMLDTVIRLYNPEGA